MMVMLLELRVLIGYGRGRGVFKPLIRYSGGTKVSSKLQFPTKVTNFYNRDLRNFVRKSFYKN